MWILIIMFSTISNTGLGSSMATAEFSTIHHCEAAAEQWKSNLPNGYRTEARHVCVIK